MNNLIRQYDGDFSAWWDNKKRVIALVQLSDRFT